MWGIGFGLEKIGLAAKRRPVIFSVLILVLSAVAALQIPNVRFNGDVTATLPEDTGAYRDFFEQKRQFRDSARDVTMLVRSERLFTAQGLEDLRFLQLDIAVSPGVTSAVSIFSIPDPDPQTGEIGQFFPQRIENDEQARELIDEALQRYPQASRLVAPDHDTAVIIVSLGNSLISGEDNAYADYQFLKQNVEETKPGDFEVLYTGLTPIGATIVGALVSDQVTLTLIGLLLGTGIAFYIFRSLMAALICATPPAMTALWSLGMFGYLGVPITYLTTVLPTLALVLAFADGIVLFFRWQSSNAQGGDLDENLVEAIRRVGPASALTSVTTVLAFLSFSFASGTALKTFSMLGMVVVTLAFVSVIIGLPLAAHWAIRAGLVKSGKVRMPAFGGLGPRLFALVRSGPGIISALALALVALLSVVHFFVTPEFRITDYLPASSEARQAEELTNEVIGGRSPVYVVVPKAEPGSSALAEANRARLEQAQQVLAGIFDEESIFSLDRLAGAAQTTVALERLSEQFDSATPSARANFVSRDGDNMLITIYIESDQAIGDTRQQIASLRDGLAQFEWADGALVTGFDVLMADEFTNLVEQLRTSLLLAILLGVVIIGIATRSPLLTVAAITPNLLPILAVELVVWLKGGTINLSEVIALTISFGIAIDNAVHVINMYEGERRKGAQMMAALRQAMEEVAPALAASTAILCVSMIVTQLSILPVVPVLGRLMIATLLVAYLSNLLILPANMLVLKRIRPWRVTQTTTQADKSAAE